MKLHGKFDVICEALDGGYVPPPGMLPLRLDQLDREAAVHILMRQFEKLAHQPAFWQALGKARGWNLTDPQTLERKLLDGRFMQCWYLYENTPMMHALRYFETVLSGGGLKAFWQSLP